jgi:biopolymer transport protein ExbB
MSETLTFFIVKGTLVVLVLASALTWALVVVKAIHQWTVGRENNRFEEQFGSASRLPSAEELGKQQGPVARLALAGAKAWEESARIVGTEPSELEIRRDILERSLRQQLQRERRGLENRLPVFATIGSTAPFVGLFGTVLGIIHALMKISGSGSASLDVVAGPIGEALVATGVGIAVAVPAVIAYNYFLRRVKAIVHDLEDFANTFVNSAIRGALVNERSADRSIARPIAVQREVSA